MAAGVCFRSLQPHGRMHARSCVRDPPSSVLQLARSIAWQTSTWTPRLSPTFNFPRAPSHAILWKSPGDQQQSICASALQLVCQILSLPKLHLARDVVENRPALSAHFSGWWLCPAGCCAVIRGNCTTTVCTGCSWLRIWGCCGPRPSRADAG